MKHPDKWRDNIDPFSLPYKAFKPTEILGYPHAGNDVFHAKGLFDGKEVKPISKPPDRWARRLKMKLRFYLSSVLQ